MNTNDIAKKSIAKQANILFGFPIEFVWSASPSKEALILSIALSNKKPFFFRDRMVLKEEIRKEAKRSLEITWLDKIGEFLLALLEV